MSTKNLNSDVNALGDMGSEEFPESLEKIICFDDRKALIVPVNSKKQILIQDRRGYKKPDWGYFGGGIEEGETPIQAVIRERVKKSCKLPLSRRN